MSPAKGANVCEIFSFLRKVFTLNGLPSFYTFVLAPFNKVSVFIYNCYVALGDAIMLFTIVRFFAKLFFYHETQSDIVEVMIAIGFVLQTTARVYILKFKRKSTDSYFLSIDEYIANTGKDLDFIRRFKEKYKTGTKVVNYLLIFQVIGAFVTFLIAPLVLNVEKNIVPGVYTFIEYHYSVRVFYVANDTLLGLIYMTRSTAIDFFCVTLVNFHTFQQQFLKSKLKITLEGIGDNGKTSGNEKERVNELMRNHQESLRSIDHLKEFLEPLLLASYMYSLINVVTILFFVLVEGHMAIFQKVMGIASIFTCFVFLGWFCIAIDELKEQLEDLPSYFYSERTIYNRGLKATYLIFGPRCQRKLKITAMGFFTLSTTGFAEVISASFSALATFWQLRGRMLY